VVKWSELGVMKMYKSTKGKKHRKYANGEDILQCICEPKEREIEEIFVSISAKDRQVTFHYNKETFKPTQSSGNNFVKILEELLIRIMMKILELLIRMLP
jgi:hypothetical protein